LTAKNDITGDLIATKFSKAYEENFDAIFRKHISSDDIPEDLSLLPEDSVWRNTPLIEIGAFYKARGAISWREVFPAFGIANKTYNELGEVWTTHDKWKATKKI